MEKRNSRLSQAEIDACAETLENLKVLRKFRKDNSWLPIHPEEVLALMPRSIKDEQIFRVCYNMFMRVQWARSIKTDKSWLPARADLDEFLSSALSTDQA